MLLLRCSMKGGILRRFLFLINICIVSQRIQRSTTVPLKEIC